jgi:L-arabinokinase
MSTRPVIVFYISGHGFGHASREIAVVNTLGARRPDLHIVLRTAVSPAMLSRTLRTPATTIEGPCDVGVIQVDSVTHDDDATIRAATAFQAGMAGRITEECGRLDGLAVQAIVGDIPPVAFEVAHRLGVPSVAISNFTWDWIYEWYPELMRQAPGLPETIRASYRLATRALELPLSGGFGVFPNVTKIPFITRHAVLSREETRRRLGLDAVRPVALLSFGGYGLPRLDLSRLDCLQDWTLLLTDRIAPPPSDVSTHVRFIAESEFGDDLRYEDLVGASDVVVTKPGYGIVSECVANKTAMLYTSRGRFREYDLMVAEMPAILRCRFLSQDDLFGGRWLDALTALMQQPPPPRRMATDGTAVAVSVLEQVLDACNTPASTSSAG